MPFLQPTVLSGEVALLLAVGSEIGDSCSFYVSPRLEFPLRLDSSRWLMIICGLSFRASLGLIDDPSWGIRCRCHVHDHC